MCFTDVELCVLFVIIRKLVVNVCWYGSGLCHILYALTREKHVSFFLIPIDYVTFVYYFSCHWLILFIDSFIGLFTWHVLLYSCDIFHIMSKTTWLPKCELIVHLYRTSYTFMLNFLHRILSCFDRLWWQCYQILHSHINSISRRKSCGDWDNMVYQCCLLSRSEEKRLVMLLGLSPIKPDLSQPCLRSRWPWRSSVKRWAE